MTNITTVQYDRKALIGAIGPSAWAKLGPEDWFDNYKMIIANSRQYETDFIVNLDMQSTDSDGLKTQHIIDSPDFMEAAQTLPGYKFIVYRPVVTPEGMSQDSFIANDINAGDYEDKKIFRDLFAHELPIAPFTTMLSSEFIQQDPTALYAQFAEEYGQQFVVQDNKWGGGIGTFIVKSVDDVARAVQVLRNERKGEYVVVSKFISGRERSIQVFTSKQRTIAGPIQQQLVRNDELLNPHERGGMYFCGGRFVFNESTKVTKQINDIVSTVAAKLRVTGYAGIFGVDFIINEFDEVYVLEVNARTTGMLPLLNEQLAQVPLYLLHILELAGQSYELPDTVSGLCTGGPLSFVVLFNQTGIPARLDDTIKTGNYNFVDGALKQIDNRARWNQEADCMVQLFASSDFLAKPNVKLCNVFMRGEGFNDDGELDARSREIITYLKQHIVEG